MAFWAKEELRPTELATTNATLPAVLAEAGAELPNPKAELVGLIVEVVFTRSLLPGSDDIVGDTDPHAGV